MTIDEAIEYIDTRAKDLEFRGFDREAQAQRLGWEALKQVRFYRSIPDGKSHNLLPGETATYCKFCGLAHPGIECPDRAREK